jgi:hypothetical protein
MQKLIHFIEDKFNSFEEQLFNMFQKLKSTNIDQNTLMEFSQIAFDLLKLKTDLIHAILEQEMQNKYFSKAGDKK